MDELTKTFGSLVANDGISLSVAEGSIHGVIGPNGAGKSTFFNTVTGYFQPDGGTVCFDGEDITGWSPDRIARRGLGRTFQIPSPFEELTVRENLLSVYTGGLGSGLRVAGEKRARADELLELLEIDHIADQAAGGISGGQEKLVELGRVLMLEPECVLLDEPTAGVNPALQEQLLDHIELLNQRGTTFVIIEHDMSVISDICERVTVLDQGDVVVEGPFEAVTGDERVREAYLGEGDHDASLTDLVDSPPAADGTVAASDTAEDSVASAATPAPTDRTAAGSATGAGGGATVTPPDARSAPADDSASVREDAWLVADDIVSGYGSHTVVDGVGVRSREGITCIFGPNGSGKSTLMKTLAGVVPAWEGQITYRGTDVTDNTPAQNVETGITMLPQDGGIFGNLTVRENLLLGAYTVDDRDLRDERIEEVLTVFPALEDKLEKKGRSLSGGQQMMLSYGRAMMTGADLFLLDEPSSGLAPSYIDDMFDLTRRLVDSGSQVILIEQNVREALRITDYVYILAQGRLQFEGDPSELTDEDDLVELYLGVE